uniref:Peptidase S1 domain-containing protein n=1 Tax=Sus scrofa TaxID=9823 RepID=A0A8D1RGC4_PIG
MHRFISALVPTWPHQAPASSARPLPAAPGCGCGTQSQACGGRRQGSWLACGLLFGLCICLSPFEESSGRSANPNEWTVQFGELTSSPSIWNLQAYYNRYQVARIFLSPRYLGSSSFDIALLRLASSVTYSKHIQPVCVPASSSEFQNQTDCWVTGWGDITEDEVLPSPHTLQEVQVGIINATMCNHLFSLPDFRRNIWGDMVCAGDPQGGKDACFGDSGGPLACKKKGLWYQIGVVSWGVGCGRPNRPGVYTNISMHYEWIRKIMAKNHIHRPDPRPLLLLPLLWAPLLLQLP